MPDTHQQDLVAALHYPVPDIVNDNGLNYRDALVLSELGLLPDGRRTILIPANINPAEEFLLDAGEIYEHRLTQTTVLPQSEIEALYISEQQTVFDFLQSELQDFEEPIPITDPEATNFVDTYGRPYAEKLRDLQSFGNEMVSQWHGGINALLVSWAGHRGRGWCRRRHQEKK